MEDSMKEASGYPYHENVRRMGGLEEASNFFRGVLQLDPNFFEVGPGMPAQEREEKRESILDVGVWLRAIDFKPELQLPDKINLAERATFNPKEIPTVDPSGMTDRSEALHALLLTKAKLEIVRDEAPDTYALLKTKVNGQLREVNKGLEDLFFIKKPDTRLAWRDLFKPEKRPLLSRQQKEYTAIGALVVTALACRGLDSFMLNKAQAQANTQPANVEVGEEPDVGKEGEGVFLPDDGGSEQEPEPTAPDSPGEIGPDATKEALSDDYPNSVSRNELLGKLGAGGEFPAGFLENEAVKALIKERQQWIDRLGLGLVATPVSNGELDDNFRWAILALNPEDKSLGGWLKIEDDLAPDGWRWAERPDGDSRFDPDTDKYDYGLPEEGADYAVVSVGEYWLLVKVGEADGQTEPVSWLNAENQEIIEVEGAAVAESSSVDPLSDEGQKMSREEYMTRPREQELLNKPENLGKNPWEVIMKDVEKDIEAVKTDPTAKVEIFLQRSNDTNSQQMVIFGKAIDVVSLPMDNIPGATKGSTAYVLMCAHPSTGEKLFPFLLAIEKSNGELVPVIEVEDYIADEEVDIENSNDMEQLVGRTIKLFVNYRYFEEDWDKDTGWSQWGNGTPKSYYPEVHEILQQSHYLDWITKNWKWIDDNYKGKLTQFFADSVSGNVTGLDGEHIDVFDPSKGDFAFLGPHLKLP